MSSINQTYATSPVAEPATAGVPADGFAGVAEGPRDAIDLAPAKASVGAQQIGKAATGAAASAYETTELLRAVGDELIVGLRQTVRINPLTSVASAMAMGCLLAGLLRLATRSRPPTHARRL